MGGEPTIVLRDFRFYVITMCIGMFVKLTLEGYP